MPRFGDELVRVLQGLGATPRDVDSLRLQGNQVGGVVANVAGWLGPSGMPTFNASPYEVFNQPGEPVAKRKHIGNQAVPNATETTLQFDTAGFDTFDPHDIVTPDGDYKVWTVTYPGIYWVHTSARFETNGAGYRYLNVSSTGGSAWSRIGSAGGAVGTVVNAEGVMYWPRASTFWVVAKQDSGGALNIDACYLDVVFLSRLK